jgi:hypothetical protein
VRLNRGGVYTQGHIDDTSFGSGEIPSNGVGAQAVDPSHHRLGAVRLVCYLIMRKQLTLSTWKRKLPFFGPLFLWSYFAPFYVGQGSWGSPGFLADLEAACKYQSEEGSQSTVGL